MKKQLFIVLITLILLVNSSLCQAADLKIGYISLGRIFQEYKKVNDSNKQLDVVKKELKQMIKEIQTLGKNFDQLNEKGQQERSKLIKDKEAKIFRRRDELRKDEDRILREILKDIEQASGEIRKKGKWNYILDDRLIIDGPEDMDLTDQILKLLNKRYKAKE